MEIFRFLPTILINSLINIVYHVSSVLPIKQRKITFASYRHNELKGNLLYVSKEIENKGLNIDCKYLLNKYRPSRIGKLVYLFDMLRASYHLATSRYFIIDDYYYPVYVVKSRKGTDIIQLWHAAGAFKKFGYSTIGKEFGPSKTYLKYVNVHSNYSYAIVSSKEVIPHYAEAFNMSTDGILPLGMPRLDYFFEKEKHIEVKKEFYEKYPELKEKKLLLYAPTYRGESFNQRGFTSLIDFNKLYEVIGDDYAILVHLHPYMSGFKSDEEASLFVYDTCNEFDVEELMIISDALITDYSSVIFDYSLLLKPILFFVPDLEDYIKERDFYYEFETFIPGPLFRNTLKIGEYIKKNQFDMIKIDNFRNKFFAYLDNENSKRVVEKVIRLK